MLEIFYRVYEVCSKEEQSERLERAEQFGFYLGREGSISKLQNKCIWEDVLICESRDRFKEIMRDSYGSDLAFAYSKRLQAGALYCIIVGEHCYEDTMRSNFQVVTFECDCCGALVEQRMVRPICFSEWEIKTQLSGNPEMMKKRFCSNRCKEAYAAENRYTSPDETAVGDLWVTTKSFDNKRCAMILTLILMLGLVMFIIMWLYG